MAESEIVFLLRGLTREKRHWEGFDEKLQNALINKKVVCLDLPGFGDRFKDTSPSSIKKIAQSVFNSDEYKTIKNQKKSLIGLSLGGMVSLEMAFQKPDEFNKLIIINASQRYKTPFHKRINFLKIPKLFFLFLFNKTLAREEYILKLTTNTKYQSEVPKKWFNYYNEKPFKRRSALLQIFAGGGFSLKKKAKVLKKTKGLILVSLKDGLVDPSSSEAIAKILEWPIEKHPTGGHDLTYDDPSWAIDKIKSHLDI